MKKRKFFTQIFSSLLLLVVIAIVVFGGYEVSVLRDFYRDSVISDLKVRAGLISKFILNDSLITEPESLNGYCRKISKEAGIRITVILPDGKVIADSHKNPELMDNHRNRPEIQNAFLGKSGHSIRYSATLKKKLIYVAIPHYHKNEIQAVIRVAMPLSEFETIFFTVKSRLIIVGFLILFLTILASYLISRKVSAPVEKIQKAAEQLTGGNFSKLPGNLGTHEMSALAKAFNTMSDELKHRIETISLQKKEQEAVFLSMKEGVITIDSGERIININQAAIDFFQLNFSAEKIKKRYVYEIFRNTELLDFIRKSLDTKENLEDEITVYAGNEKILLVRANKLLTQNNETLGTIIVLSDITRVKEWDKMRQDFVANVSHELKTPITSIKGYVETLLANDIKDKELERKFLKIINRHANQLDALIDDLLQLSKLDKTTAIETDKQLILPLIKNASQCCPRLLEDKNIIIDIDCPEDLTAKVNANLFERAIVNLIDNAVKYSYKDGRILITVKKENGNIVISIRDWGCGIPPEHHSRLFERFYRVDKGRSREMGGTGLGLSIVKHIVLAHNGKVYVESKPGKGSTFFIVIPSA